MASFRIVALAVPQSLPPPPITPPQAPAPSPALKKCSLKAPLCIALMRSASPRVTSIPPRSKFGVSFSALSSWASRVRVALDVAKGLEYLHHLTVPALIHKYMDSRNILVGNDLRAKVAHVGVSVLTGEVEFSKMKIPDLDERLPADDKGEIQLASSNRRIARSRSIKINGIQGYMPPEYLNSGKLTSKYDVFAFGVILAEIISGQEAVSSVRGDSKPQQVAKRVLLPDLLRSVMSGDDSKSKLRRWMDPLLRDSFPLDDAHKAALIAMACMDPDPLKRPDMSDIGLRLQKLLVSAEKYEAAIAAQQELMTASLQPRPCDIHIPGSRHVAL
ncbi:hypothetical protein GOP47_0030300 [Adiantum capillus-veneris]|nr:hypothetical protein GOP47_0030300 [Adiantum capillus-veneris]